MSTTITCSSDCRLTPYHYSPSTCSGLGSSGSWVVENGILYGMVIAIMPLENCAVILPQRRMYSDIKEIFPDATSIQVSSWVPPADPPRIKSEESVTEESIKQEIHSTPNRRQTRGSTVWGKQRKEKAPILSDIAEEKKPWEGAMKNESDSGIFTPDEDRKGKARTLSEIDEGEQPWAEVMVHKSASGGCRRRYRQVQHYCLLARPWAF